LGKNPVDQVRTREEERPLQRIERTALAAFTAVEVAILLIALAKPAYGYVDPGSGLLAIQVGGSMLAGALFIVRTKIRKLFRMKAPAGEPDSEKPVPPGPEK
jgi:hypothetical protein